MDELKSLLAEGDKHTFAANSIAANLNGDRSKRYGSMDSKMREWVDACGRYLILHYTVDSAPRELFEKFDDRKIKDNGEQEFERQKGYIISALNACLSLSTGGGKNNIDNRVGKNLKKEVFIVHGHDSGVKSEAARFIEALGFKAIILHEQSDKGMTVIEKIEKHSDVGFGVVLYTPCDVGKGKDTKQELKARARQNVIFEHGYLIGKLGRDRVCTLIKDEVEEPSDLRGVVFTKFDADGAWRNKLARELKEAGYPVDMNDI